MTMDCNTAETIKYVSSLAAIATLGIAGLIVDGDAGTAVAIACAGAIGLFLPSPIVKKPTEKTIEAGVTE